MLIVMPGGEEKRMFENWRRVLKLAGGARCGHGAVPQELIQLLLLGPRSPKASKAQKFLRQVAGLSGEIYYVLLTHLGWVFEEVV